MTDIIGAVVLIIVAIPVFYFLVDKLLDFLGSQH